MKCGFMEKSFDKQNGWMDGRMDGWMDGWILLRCFTVCYGTYRTVSNFIECKVKQEERNTMINALQSSCCWQWFADHWFIQTAITWLVLTNGRVSIYCFRQNKDTWFGLNNIRWIPIFVECIGLTHEIKYSLKCNF